MRVSSVDQSSCHQVIKERRTNSTPFMVMNKVTHQEIVISNLQKIITNPGPLLPKPVLWFWLSWVDLIIMPLIIVMLRFTLNSINLNLPLNLFQILTQLKSNQFIMMKWTISYNYSTQIMMVLFWMLTFRCFRLD